MRTLKQISRNLLRGHFLLVAVATGWFAGSVLERMRNAAPDDPEKDRLTAVFSPAGDPALNKYNFGDTESETAWIKRHHEMMKDSANVQELQAWLSKNFDAVMNESRINKIEAARKAVQKHMTYASDDRLYGGDYVAPPLQSIRARHGDCDDYAALYYLSLRYLGFSDSKCFELRVYTNGGNNLHKVVLADTSGVEETRLLSKNLFILDNGGGLLHLEQTDFIPRLLINRSGSAYVRQVKPPAGHEGATP
jgi:predicted transglutaminase-like cysteine proteinase